MFSLGKHTDPWPAAGSAGVVPAHLRCKSKARAR